MISVRRLYGACFPLPSGRNAARREALTSRGGTDRSEDPQTRRERFFGVGVVLLEAAVHRLSTRTAYLARVLDGDIRMHPAALLRRFLPCHFAFLRFCSRGQPARSIHS